MIFTVPLQPGTTLANVLYAWIEGGVYGTPTSTGVTQPSVSFAVFRIDCIPSATAEEMIVYDSTDLTNWNVAGYRKGLSLLETAETLYLASPWSSTQQPQVIVPSSPASLSICRCYGTWTDISSLSVNGVPMTLTLVAVDDADPTIIYDLTSTPLKNTETTLLVAQRVVNCMLVAGQLQNVNEDNFVDLNRTDYISGAPAASTLYYMLTCDALGAPTTFSLLSSESPVQFTPVLFKLDTSTIGVSSSGTFDLAKKAVA